MTALTSLNLPESRKRYLELHYGCKKVSNYQEEDLKKLFKFILALCKLVGVTEAPDNDIILLLIDHIQEHHKDFSKEEIQKAFSMATAGKLDFDFVHYNRITPQLISTTLNSYKKIRSKEIIDFQHKLRLEEEQKIREANKPSEKELLIQKVQVSLNLFNTYKDKKNTNKEEDSVIDWGNLSYDFLVDLGLINYTIQQKEEIKETAKSLIVQRKRREFSEFKKKEIGKLIQAMNGDNTPNILIKESKQIALDMYFDSLIEFKISLEDKVLEALNNHKDKIYKEVGNIAKKTIINKC